jgi:hypothetical protein
MYYMLKFKQVNVSMIFSLNLFIEVIKHRKKSFINIISSSGAEKKKDTDELVSEPDQRDLKSHKSFGSGTLL